jgi:hypothetical protein
MGNPKVQVQESLGLINHVFEALRSLCQKLTASYFVKRYPFVIAIGVTEMVVDP